MAEGKLFPKGAILDMICKMLLKANYFAAHKDKNLICMSSFYKRRDDTFMHVCRIPHNFSSIDVIQFFNAILFL